MVEWNGAKLAKLAGAPLLNPQVTVQLTDVADVIKDGRSTFDAVLPDMDNGAGAFTVARNRRLDGPHGLEQIRRILRPSGVFGVWSADPDRPFERRLSQAGFQLQVETVPAHQKSKSPTHTIFIDVVP